MKLNGYTQTEVEEFYTALNFNERYVLDHRAAAQSLHPLEAAANRMYHLEKVEAERETQATLEATRKASLNAETTTQALTPTTKKAVERIISKADKARRSEIARLLGGKWNQFANPQTREKVYAEMTENTGLRILRKL